MEITIKKKISKIKIEYDENNELINVDYLDIFFDVESTNNYYIDIDGNGFFPLEIVDNDNTDEEIKQICIDWITENNILSIYKPIYSNLEEKQIADKKLEILDRQARDELGL